MPIQSENALQNATCNKVAGLYDIGKTIGKGHFAVVKEAKHVFTQEKVAIKIIDKTKLDKISQDQLLSEVMCMKLVQHPNIIRLYEVIDTVNKLYLVLELGDGGDLYDYLLSKGNNGLPEEEAKHYFRQIVRALAYCHNLHVVHRDIKPENVVFFKQSEVVKLTDFGFSNKFIPGETLNTSCGSLAYSAPEILLGDSYDAPKVDIWSLGVILYMLVTGSLPFNETNDSETIANTMDCKYTVPNRISESCRNLIGKMLRREANHRASLDNIINDEWLRFISGSWEYELENYSIPLISQEHLTLEEHIEILTKMSDGNLASVEETQKILDSKGYNHISATYFLLAERKLKRNYVDKYIQMKSRQRCDLSTKDEIHTANLDKSKSSQNVGKQMSLEASRRISMILEGEETEENEEIDAMASLAIVKRELENFMPNTDAMKLPGTTAPNPSRCVSRINSAYDLHSMSDGYDSDPVMVANKSRSKLMYNSEMSYSSFSSQISDIYQLPKEMLEDILNENGHRNRSELVGKPLKSKSPKKSSSATDISAIPDPTLKIDLGELTNNLHKFAALSTISARHKNNSNQYAAVQHVALNDRRLTQVFFDTGSNSTSANCSSPDISDIESDSKSKMKYQKSSIKKMDNRTSDVFDHHDICEPINEEDEINRSNNFAFPNDAKTYKNSNNCFRSRSFDGRFANTVHIDTTTERPVIARKSDNRSWCNNSISVKLADSNFSLASFASKLDQPNMMQVIRGTFELQIRSQQDNTNRSKSMPRNSCPSNLSPNALNLSRKTKLASLRNTFKPTSPIKKKSITKFKIPFLSNTIKDRKASANEHSKVNSSNSCHILPSEKSSKSDLYKNHVTNTNSNPQLSLVKEKNSIVSFKRDHLTCCILS